MNNTTSSEQEKTVKKRNRATLVCLPCRKKKVKCDKGKPCSNCNKSQPDKCIYDERILESKKRKKPSMTKPEPNGTNNSDATSSIPNVTSQDKEQQQQQQLAKERDVCVLIQKSELQELQAKLKQYESLENHTTTSNHQQFDIPGESSNSTHHHHLHGIKNKNDNIVFNNSSETRSSLVFTKHDETRPGFIPLVNVTSEKPHFPEKRITTTKTLELSKLPTEETNLIGINPYDHPDDVIDFHKQLPNTFGKNENSTMSPLSWSYAIRSSSIVRTLRYFASLQYQKDVEKQVTSEIAHNKLKKLIVPGDEKIKSALNLDSSYESRFQEKIKQALDDGLNKHHLKTPPEVNMTTLALGLSLLNGNKDRELSLIEQIKSAMPTKKVIWLLIKRYFQLIYPIIPYVVEDNFREDVERIVGKESYEDIKPDVKIENRMNFATISVLFVICRLLFLSLFHNRGFYNEQILTKKNLTKDEAERKFLILNSIKIHNIEVAQACYQHLQRLGKITLPLLQCAIYLRAYRTLAPEEGDGIDGGDSLVQHSSLVSMSYLLGLNRDPDKISYVSDAKVKHLYRKIWYYCLMQEYTLAHTYGTPLYIRPESYDTKRPYFSLEGAGCRDLEVEKSSLTVFAFISALVKGPIKDLVVLCNNVGQLVKVSEITTELNCIELAITELLGKVSDYVHNLEEESTSYHTNKIMKIGILFRINSLLMTMYCNMFTYYERKNVKLSLFYFKKFFKLSVHETLPYVFSLITRSKELFGEGSDLYINPAILLFLVRTMDVCFSSMVRSNFSLYKMSHKPNHQLRLSSDPSYKEYFDSCNRFMTVMEKVSRLCLAACSIFSSRYYFAWGVVKMRGYFLKLITTPKFYKVEIEGDYVPIATEAKQINELSELIELGLMHLESQVTKYCDDIDFTTFLKKIASNKKLSKLKQRKQQKKVNPQPQQNIPPHTPPVYQTHEHPHSNKLSPSGVSTTEDSHTPNSMDSNNNSGVYSTEFEDLKFVNSAEIDSIWLQMMNLKSHNQNDGFNYNPTNSSNAPYHPNYNNGGDNNRTFYPNPNTINDAFGYPLPNQFFEQNFTNFANFNPNADNNEAAMFFDMFDNVPLDKFFNQ